MPVYMKIPGVEAGATNDGRIFSYRLGREVAQCNDSDGYKLCKVDGVMCRVHRLVAMAWYGASKLVVNHKNGIKNDNRIDNLEFCTVSENNRHALDTGLASSSHLQRYNEKAKRFTDSEIRHIRASLLNTNTLAKKYGVSRGVIWQIQKQITYKGIK